MQNRKDSLILKQKGNYISLLKHGESVQVNEERGYCCPRTAKTGNLYRKRTDNCDMLPSYRTMKYKSPIWGYFHVQKE